MDPVKRYKTDAITTQQRGKLIVMLYEGAIRFLNIAKEKLQEGDYALKGVYIGKAQDIVAELNNSLNVEAAPDIGNDLRALYNFMYGHLNEANIERSVQKIEDCINILAELREAWEQVASSPEASTADDAGAVPPTPLAAGGYQA
jgi:flagellar protein FliS